MSKRSQIFIVIFFLLILRFSTQLRSFDRANVLDYGYDDSDNFTMLISGGFRPPGVVYARYMVSIRTARPTAYFGDNHYCSGVIIAARAVVTAAHCVVDSRGMKTRPRRINVVAGTPKRLVRSSQTFEVGVEEVIPHEHYVRHVKNDIAILRLQTALPDSSPFIKIIILAKHRIDRGKICTVVGWGQIFNKGPYANSAVSVNLTILPNSKCKSVYPEFFMEGMNCAGDPLDWDKSACRGDSGSPLVCNNFLYGVVSWIDTCGKENAPSVFTDIAYYRDWILKVSGMEALQVTSAVKFSFMIMLGVALQKFCITV